MTRRARLHVVSERRTRPSRVLGYCRVSSEEQTKGTSLEDQRTAIRSYASSLGMSVERFYVEAESGGARMLEHREQIKALMAEVRAGDLVVVSKLDRWSRDVAFSYSSVEKIVKLGADFYLLTERCGPHDDNWDTIFGVHALVARLEHKRIRERTVGTRKQLKDRGLWAEGLPPFGYRRSLGKGERGISKNVLVIHEPEADKVRAAYRLCIAGRSLDDIAEDLELGRDRVRTMLTNRVHIGQVRDSAGMWIKGQHQAIVTADTWQRAQDAMQARRLGGPRPRGSFGETSGWILRDVATCAHCGARMSSSYAGPLDARRYYYRCAHSCSSRYVRVETLERAAEVLIVERLEQLREELAREPVRPEATVSRIDVAAKRARIEAKRQRFLEAFGDGLTSREELRGQFGKLDAEKARLDAVEASAKRPSPLADASVRRAALASVGGIRKAWTSATPETKRQIVGHLAKAARIAHGEPVVFVWRTAEDLAELA